MRTEQIKTGSCLIKKLEAWRLKEANSVHTYTEDHATTWKLSHTDMEAQGNYNLRDKREELEPEGVLVCFGCLVLTA